MGRLNVISSVDGSRMPFLRGVLTRSLQNCGLSFDDAFAIASKVRGDIASLKEISAADLRKRVLASLDSFSEEIRKRYESPRHRTGLILVRSPDGHTSPLSRGGLRLKLECCGLNSDKAVVVASAMHDDLLARGLTEISEEELKTRTHARLRQELGDKGAAVYLSYEAFRASGVPLVLLVGGAPGTGKSTVSSQIAHMFEISRTQPTDLLREVMRVMIPERLVPVLHRSSFRAGEALPGAEELHNGDSALVSGFLAQSDLVTVACEAALKRALDERLSIILEGVHIHPRALPKVPDPDAIVVHLMLAVIQQKTLRARIRGRGKDAPDRRAARFLDHFEGVWGLQSWLLTEAEKAGITVVENSDREHTIQEIAATIMRAIAKRFPGKPG
jgi:2-phosphoglycerate kinase